MEYILQRMGIGLALGLLVGLQRQRNESRIAGLRTVPIVTLLGLTAALTDLHLEAGGWITAATAIAVTGVLVVGELLQFKKFQSTGITTAVAAIFMYVLGAYLAVGSATVAVTLGAGLAVLLQFKPELHALAQRFTNDDLRAIMQFVLFSLVILPILPNRTFGPLDAFNPFETWLMVVLIVGISLGGYIAYKFFGRDAGILLSGILGGAISSTATTVSYSRRTRERPEFASIAAVVIMIASALVFVRVLLEIAIVAPKYWWQLAPAIIAMLVAAMVGGQLAWLRVVKDDAALPRQSNPTELRSALLFGVLYAGVTFALAVAKQYWGTQGLYAVAALSGLTDMDAITLSTARLVGTESARNIPPSVAWRLIVTAALSNLAFKAIIFAAMGHRKLLRCIAPMYALPALVAAVLLVVF